MEYHTELHPSSNPLPSFPPIHSLQQTKNHQPNQSFLPNTTPLPHHDHPNSTYNPSPHPPPLSTHQPYSHQLATFPPPFHQPHWQSNLSGITMAEPNSQHQSVTSSSTGFDRSIPSPTHRSSISNLFSQYSPPAQHHKSSYLYTDSPRDSLVKLDHSEASSDPAPHQQHKSFFNPIINQNHSHSSSSLAENEDQALGREDVKNSSKSFKQDKKVFSKTTKKKSPPKFFSIFAYRQLMLIGLAAIFLIASAVVIILVMHLKRNSTHLNNGDADDSNDITSQSGLGSARNVTSDGLDPFNRTDSNNNNGFPPDNGRRGGANGYDSLIVFGASYCDNAHARPDNLRSSLKPHPYYKGRWTNGYVWDEYLSAILGPGGRRTTLVNYAFGGATVDNALNEAPVPDLDQQVNAFLSDLKAQSPGAGPSDGKSLIAIWIGINSVTKIWNSVLKQQVHARSQVEVQEIMAQAQVNINLTVNQIFNVVANLIHTNAFRKASPDLMILTIPPVQLLLVNIRAAKGNMASLRTLGTLNEMFNNQFNTQFNLLQDNLAQQQVQSSLSTINDANLEQRLFTLDIQNIWRKFINEPSSSNLTVVDQPCLTKLGVCNQAQSYLFWDTLHPTTHVHKELALMMSDEIGR